MLSLRIIKFKITFTHRLLGDPETRVAANVSLDVAVAPLTEFRYVHDDRGGGGGGKGNAGEATGDREHRRNCAFQVGVPKLSHERNDGGL